jgi:hypothetical protein
LKHLSFALLFLLPGLYSGAQISLTQTGASRLAQLPLKCMQQEYPNKMGQVLNSRDDLHSPAELHPAFYGCFDWHSSVHGHWLLVRLMKEFPGLEAEKEIRAKLNEQLTEENIWQEIAYFGTKLNESFERTYGWNWLLKLQLELQTWNDKDARRWSAALQPLSDLIVQKYCSYLPKLNYAIRTGDHINTAFGMTFAHDYAVKNGIDSLKTIIEARARYFFLNDSLYPLRFEPGGYDFLSPALVEADLMRRVLSKKEFSEWLDRFLPQLKDPSFSLEPGRVSDRSDGHLVHLDGLNFSRAWCLFGIAETDKRYSHLKKIAEAHIAFSLPSITDGDYMGEHWLASFAVLSLLEVRK